MQFLDLKSQYSSIKKEVDAAIKRVLDSSIFIGGPEVKLFEEETAKFSGARFAVSVNSGTDALFLSLKALGINFGDEIITTPFTFIATAEIITACGAKPIFVDIDPKTFNISPSKLEEKLNQLKKLNQIRKVKAIIPVHLFGQMADMPEIMKIARKYKLKVVEDAAQAIGAEQQATNNLQLATQKSKIKKASLSAEVLTDVEALAKAGSVGDLGCFSFFPSKNLGAYGDGGMIITNNQKLADKIRLLKNHGSSPKEKYKNLILGVNSRLDAIQAAILRVKLKYLKDWSRKRAEKASYYSNQFNKLNTFSELVFSPYVAPGSIHIYHQYTIRVNSKLRSKLIKHLSERGIPTMIYYPLPLHFQPAFKYLGYKRGYFPETEKAAKEVLSLPIYPEIKKKDQDFAVQKIKEFYEKKN